METGRSGRLWRAGLSSLGTTVEYSLPGERQSLVGNSLLSCVPLRAWKQSIQSQLMAAPSSPNSPALRLVRVLQSSPPRPGESLRQSSTDAGICKSSWSAEVQS